VSGRAPYITSLFAAARLQYAAQAPAPVSSGASSSASSAPSSVPLVSVRREEERARGEQLQKYLLADFVALHKPSQRIVINAVGGLDAYLELPETKIDLTNLDAAVLSRSLMRARDSSERWVLLLKLCERAPGSEPFVLACHQKTTAPDSIWVWSMTGRHNIDLGDYIGERGATIIEQLVEGTHPYFQLV
jgi:hypothetical protein